MKAGMVVVLGSAGSLLANLVSGCKDPVGPEMPATYETAVFGTFRQISAQVSGGGLVDSTSYVCIGKSDGRYSIRLRGTARTRQFSFDEAGLACVERVTYTAREGLRTGYWKGRIRFEPDSALHRIPWVLPFLVYDLQGVRDHLDVDGIWGPPLSQENDTLRLMSWKP
jgi:hypothetical protein